MCSDGHSFGDGYVKEIVNGAVTFTVAGNITVTVAGTMKIVCIF